MSAGTVTLYPGDTLAVTVAAVAPPSVRRFGPSDGKAAFEAAIRDLAVDVIELTAGTYLGWRGVNIWTGRPTPVLVRPAAGAVVIFDGAGTAGSSDGLFHFGSAYGSPPSGVSRVARNVRFDGAGGTWIIQNYALGQIGLVYTQWAQNIEVSGLIVRDCVGTGNGHTSHCVYVSSDSQPGHAAKDLRFDRWLVDVTGPRLLNGLQIYAHEYAERPARISAGGWSVRGLNDALIAWQSSGVDVHGWLITDCNRVLNSDGTATGRVSAVVERVANASINGQLVVDVR